MPLPGPRRLREDDGVRRVLVVLAVAVGAVLAAIGVWCSTGPRPASFGWTAYAPLSDTTYVVPVGPPVWATALVVLGSLMVGAAVTLLLVRRRPQ
jgi:heme/copper-type cytochrome/quinol oxidase subunit 1